MIEVEKIYVLHYTKLKERRERLEKVFSALRMNVEWITEFDQEDLTDELIDQVYDKRKESYDAKIHPTYQNRSTPHRVLNKAEISCTFKHRLAIQKIATECNNFGLILEDDVVFCDDFVQNFNTFLGKTPNNWDAIFMGSCANLHIPRNCRSYGQVAYPVGSPASRGGDSYMLRTELAQKIVDTMETFVTISDWELSYQLHKHNAVTYWWEPSLVTQGSECGLYNSTLR